MTSEEALAGLKAWQLGRCLVALMVGSSVEVMVGMSEELMAAKLADTKASNLVVNLADLSDQVKADLTEMKKDYMSAASWAKQMEKNSAQKSESH